MVIKNSQMNKSKKFIAYFEKSINLINNHDFLKACKVIDMMGNSSSDKLLRTLFYKSYTLDKIS